MRCEPTTIGRNQVENAGGLSGTTTEAEPPTERPRRTMILRSGGASDGPPPLRALSPVKPGDPRRTRARRSWLSWAACTVTYLPLAVVAYLPALEHWSLQMNGCNCWDQVLEEWGIAWWPAAIAHGHALFTTTYLDAPGGVNLMWNTSMPALGLAASPLSFALGPVHTFLVLLVLSGPVSGAAMFLLLRRWTAWLPAAWVGGLLYGFSSYMAAQSTVGRLHLIFVPIPPLIVLVIDKLLRDTRPRRVRLGTTLGVLCAVQFLISEEILLMTALLVAAGLLVLALLYRDTAVRHALALGRAASAAVATFLCVAGWFLAVQLFGADRLTGPPQPHAQLNLFSSDVVSPVVPGIIQLFHPSWALAVSSRFDAATPGEAGSYIGASLLAALVVGIVVLRRRRIVQFFAVMALASFALSWSPRLIVANHHLPIPGPYAALARLPLMGDFIPGRFALGMWFSIAVLFSVELDVLHRSVARHRAANRPVHRHRQPWRAMPVAITAALVGACLLPLVPNWPYLQLPARVPHFFTSATVDRIRSGSLMVTYPYPRTGLDEAMVWQAETAMRFRLLGGYYIAPDRHGAGTLFGDPNQLSVCLEGISRREAATKAMCDRTALRQALIRLGVTSIAVDRSAAGADAARRVLASAAGAEPTVIGGVDLWQCEPGPMPTRCRWS